MAEESPLSSGFVAVRHYSSLEDEPSAINGFAEPLPVETDETGAPNPIKMTYALYYPVGAVVVTTAAAMVPQGEAAFMQTLQLLMQKPPTTATPTNPSTTAQAHSSVTAKQVVISSIVAVGSYGGKVCLLLFYGIDNAKQLGVFIRDDLLRIEYWKEVFKGGITDAGIVKGVCMLNALVPALGFSMITKLANDSFISLVNQVKPSGPIGTIISGLAMVAGTDITKGCLYVSSAYSNLVSAPGIPPLTKLLLWDIPKKEFQQLKSYYDYTRYWLSVLAGVLGMAVIGVGFYNFLPLGSKLLQEYLGAPKWLGVMFGVLFLAYMYALGSINAFTLLKSATHTTLDVITFRQAYPPLKILLAHTIAAVLSAAICFPGGLPAVWQAKQVHEDATMAWFANMASFLTEFAGTKAVLLLIGSYLLMAMINVLSKCVPETAPIPARDTSRMELAEIDAPADNSGSWLRAPAQALRDCIGQCWSFGNDRKQASVDAVAAAVGPLQADAYRA